MSSDLSIDDDLKAQLSVEAERFYENLSIENKNTYRRMYINKGTYNTVDAIERTTALDILVRGDDSA
jgi:hypothetical protein